MNESLSFNSKSGWQSYQQNTQPWRSTPASPTHLARGPWSTCSGSLKMWVYSGQSDLYVDIGITDWWQVTTLSGGTGGSMWWLWVYECQQSTDCGSTKVDHWVWVFEDGKYTDGGFMKVKSTLMVGLWRWKVHRWWVYEDGKYTTGGFMKVESTPLVGLWRLKVHCWWVYESGKYTAGGFMKVESIPLVGLWRWNVHMVGIWRWNVHWWWVYEGGKNDVSCRLSLYSNAEWPLFHLPCFGVSN